MSRFCHGVPERLMHDELDTDPPGMPAGELAASTADEFVDVDALLEPSAG